MKRRLGDGARKRLLNWNGKPVGGGNRGCRSVRVCGQSSYLCPERVGKGSGRKGKEGEGRVGGRIGRWAEEWADRSAGLIKYSRGERGLPADFCATGGAIVAVLVRPTRRSTSESLSVDLRVACVSRLHRGFYVRADPLTSSIEPKRWSASEAAAGTLELALSQVEWSSSVDRTSQAASLSGRMRTKNG
jgi:hypothetical protein